MVTHGKGSWRTVWESQEPGLWTFCGRSAPRWTFCEALVGSLPSSLLLCSRFSPSSLLDFAFSLPHKQGLIYCIFISFPAPVCAAPSLAPPAALPSPPPMESLAGCLAQLTADQSRVCHSRLSPDAPNGAPFSCLVGGSGGGGNGGRRGQIDPLTEIVPGRERE